MPHVRPPAVAGAFYPADPQRLTDQVDGLLAQATLRRAPRPFALVVPHAGYAYSGPIAATAYARVKALEPKPLRVALFGPSHYAAFEGLALPEADLLRTPLGDVRMDGRAVERALLDPNVLRSDAIHEEEHSLEVQLPFLQRVLPSVPVLPFAVGRARAEVVAGVMEAMLSCEGTLLLVSTDLSHFLTAEQARALDAQTADAVLALTPDAIASNQACGSVPLKGLLTLAGRLGARAELLDLRNSSDTAGDPRRVVGYGAFAFYRSERS